MAVLVTVVCGDFPSNREDWIAFRCRGCEPRHEIGDAGP